MDSIQKLANEDVSYGLSEHNVFDEYKTLSVEERRLVCKRESIPFDVAVLNVTGELNVGNIVRTASVCGFSKVHILGRRKYDKRGTVGAENYIEVERHDVLDQSDNLRIDPVKAKQYFLDNNLIPVFVEQYDAYAEKFTIENIEQLKILGDDLINSPTKKRLVFVFGNEGRGIPHQVIEQFNIPIVVELRQRGVIRSMNVGSAAAIVMYAVSMLYSTR